MWPYLRNLVLPQPTIPVQVVVAGASVVRSAKEAKVRVATTVHGNKAQSTSLHDCKKKLEPLWSSFCFLVACVYRFSPHINHLNPGVLRLVEHKIGI